jgi:hypothetical protein
MQAMCDAILINSMAGWPGRALAVQCRWAAYQVLPRYRLNNVLKDVGNPPYVDLRIRQRSLNTKPRPMHHPPGLLLAGERQQLAAFSPRFVASQPHLSLFTPSQLPVCGISCTMNSHHLVWNWPRSGGALFSAVAFAAPTFPGSFRELGSEAGSPLSDTALEAQHGSEDSARSA